MRLAVRFAVVVVLSSFSVASAKDARTRDITPEMGSVVSQFSEAFAVNDGGLLVLAGRAGFQRTNNDGKLWHRAMRGYVSANDVEPYGNGFCQAPSEASTVYSPGFVFGPVQIENPVFRSDNLGKTWRRVGTIPLADQVVSDCAVDASNPQVLYALPQTPFETPGLFKSTDGGHSFTAVGAGLDEGLSLHRVRTSPTRPKTVYVIGRRTEFDEEFNPIVTGAVYVSTDGGVTFAPLPASPPIPSRVEPHPTVDGMLFVVGCAGSPSACAGNDGQPRLFRSTDGGAMFAPVGPVGTGFVTFDPDEPAGVFALIGTDGLYRSRDFGATFARLPGPTPDQMGPLGMNAVAVTNSRNGRKRIYVSTERGPYRSDDGGRTFTSIRETFRGTGVNDLAIDADGRLMVGAVLTAPVFRAQKAGHPRSYEVFGASLGAVPQADAGAVAPSPVDANTAVVATRSAGVLSTSDGGRSWTEALDHEGFPEPASFGPFGSRVHAVFAPGSATRVYLFANVGLLRSDDAGLSFERTAPFFRPGFQRALAVDPSDPDVLYLVGGEIGRPHGLLKSVDGGHTIVSLGLSGEFSTLAIDPHAPRTVYAGNSAGGVVRSTDGGATWLQVGSGLPPGATLAIAVDPLIEGRVYAWVQAGGLFVSGDRGGTWTAADAGESVHRSGINIGQQAAIAVDRVVPGRVYLGHSGVLQIDTLPGEDR
jgi:photosystem II stability/assembly factor-like uncharacterized protein